MSFDKKFVFDGDKIDLSSIDNSLVSAVIICLFTDAYVPNDELPSYISANAGWHGDAIPLTINGVSFDGYSWGSKLWTLKRAKITAETLSKVKEYVEEALSPLITAKAVTSINVTTEVLGERINFLAEIKSPLGDVSLTFNNVTGA